MDDPACKQLFSRPRMVEDLLHGFAARDWSGALDFASLAPLPASYVSHDLRQRHGDLVWRVRFHDQRWLHLEFQSTVDRAMAVRMLAYTTLLYQKLIGEGGAARARCAAAGAADRHLQRPTAMERGGGRI
ncbi:MAG: Rpn family recombination-promoting nuclease/putative transposase [Acidobacteria bacterium]|nr:Rpn family recombination-promoting nuclease/putative transposase [Acidobacteriota bacterium]